MKTQMGRNQMRKLGLATALLAGSAMTTPAFADGHLRIVEEPLELTIQMNHARYPVYEENWPVEQAARKMTGIHLINDTVGASMRTDENTGRTEALNPMLASATSPTSKLPSRLPMARCITSPICPTANMAAHTGSAPIGWKHNGRCLWWRGCAGEQRGRSDCPQDHLGNDVGALEQRHDVEPDEYLHDDEGLPAPHEGRRDREPVVAGRTGWRRPRCGGLRHVQRRHHDNDTRAGQGTWPRHPRQPALPPDDRH